CNSRRRVSRPRSCLGQSSRRAVHRSHPSGGIYPSWNAPAPGLRVLPVSLRWRGVLSRRSCQVLRGCAPEAALASCLRARQSAGCDTDSSAAWALRDQDLNDLFLIKKLSRDDLAFQQFDNLAMGQGRDGVQTFDPLDLFSHRFGNHPTVADKDNFFQAVEALQLRDLLGHGRGVLSITGKNFDSDRTTLRAAE